MNLEQKYITSLEVADMMEIEHYKIIRKLEGDKDRKGFIQVLTDSQMGVSDYFTESTYTDASGKQISVTTLQDLVATSLQISLLVKRELSLQLNM